MKAMDSTDAKTNFGALLDAAQRGPVTIKKKGRPVAVLYSYEDSEIIEELRLEDLHRKIREGIDQADRGELLDGEKVFAGLLTKNAARPRTKR